MKVRRSNRLIDMTKYLLDRPHTLIPLTFFVDRYGSAKSSISEDLGILKQTFSDRGIGIVDTIPGAAGGTRFLPSIPADEAKHFVDQLKDALNDDSRYLAGGYIFMSDVLSRPNTLRTIGRIMATKYVDKKIDAVLTVATKGIPIAQSIAANLNVPFVVAQHDSKITDGSTISVNYVSGSNNTVKKMVLSKRSLESNSKVLIVDDYLKGGGTVNGLSTLAREFNCEVAGISVLAEENYDRTEFADQQYVSLVKVDINHHITVSDGNFLSTVFGQK
ncbi:pur operon repressor [Lactobacillaceae bacterium Scapto_B20]